MKEGIIIFEKIVMPFCVKKGTENEKQQGFKDGISRVMLGTCLHIAFSDGSDTRDRLYAVSHALARASLRIYLRVVLGSTRRVCRASVSLVYCRNAPSFSNCSLYGV